MLYSFSLDDRVISFDASSMGLPEAGYAYLFDQEGCIVVIIKNWDWVELEEQNPEVE